LSLRDEKKQQPSTSSSKRNFFLGIRYISPAHPTKNETVDQEEKRKPCEHLKFFSDCGLRCFYKKGERSCEKSMRDIPQDISNMIEWCEEEVKCGRQQAASEQAVSFATGF